MKRLAAVLLMAWLAQALSPAAAPPAAVEKIVEGQMAKRRIPAVAVAVVRNGEPEFMKAWGVADLELGAPARTAHLFEIGSITKPFTAMIVLMLAEEGKTRLDAPVGDVLPNLPAAWKPVTVRQLMNHTGGLPNYTAQRGFAWEKTTSPDDVMKLVKDLPLDFAPGERMSYSNTGYYVLGLLIEKITGKPYADALRERILDPAGMSSARLSTREVIPNRAHGYITRPDSTLNAQMILAGTAGAAGAMLASIEDMARWEAALHARRFLKPASYEAMWTPPTLTDGGKTSYALGWVVRDEKGHHIQNHSGGTDGFSSTITRVEPENITVIVLCNAAMNVADAVTAEVLGHYVPDLKPEPPVASARTDTDPQRTARVKGKVLSLLSESPDLGGMTDDMKAALTPALLADLREQMKTLGQLNTFAFLNATDGPAGRTFAYRAVFGETPLIVTATFDAGDRIAGLFMRPE